MRQVIVSFLTASFLFCVGYLSYAQTAEVSESEISFEILKWHYHHYPNSTTNVWKVIDDGRLYEADFTYEGFDVVTMYDSDGKPISENQDLSKNVPVSLIHHLDDTYDKYKVRGFWKITSFKDETVFYEMEIKSKERGDETLNFDENLIPVDFNLVSKAN